MVALLKNLEDQVNRQSKELRDLKRELMIGKRISPPIEKRSKALDGHAWNLIELLSKRQGSYTTNELVEMLGLNKTTVISVMDLGILGDPQDQLGHVSLATTGIYLKASPNHRREAYMRSRLSSLLAGEKC